MTKSHGNNCLLNYNETINELTSQGKFYINLGLERISEVLELSGNPQDRLKCIQVAGTNGKGSVCSMLSSVLTGAGYKTGLYTSPHIFEYTERIKINGTDISKEDFALYCSQIMTLADVNNIHLTEFEILTAVMYKYFADNNVDIAIIETGLGGRYDATNVLKTNLCSVITHIDLDHTDRLGDTKDKIAYEKAGIIKPNSFVVTSEPYEVVKDKADELNSMMVLVNPICDEKYTDALSLKGVNQIENLALVLAVFDTLFPDINDEKILSGLSKVKNPCRFEYIAEKNLILDGAHNPNCFSALIKNLDKYFPDIKRNYVFGCLNTKDYGKMLEYIKSDKNLNNLYLYHFDNPNSCTFKDLSELCPFAKELESKQDILYSSDYLTVICGSFYMLKELI